MQHGFDSDMNHDVVPNGEQKGKRYEMLMAYQSNLFSTCN
jgi:hypothetical protein